LYGVLHLVPEGGGEGCSKISQDLAVSCIAFSLILLLLPHKAIIKDVLM
jgi:hypothetical protein